MKKSILLALLFTLPSLAQADFSGRVVRVIDGDTVSVLAGNQMFRVRLNGIDAPESKQAYGQRSKQSLIALVAQKDVLVISSNQDRYGRYLGTIMKGTSNINAEQVKNGMAWAYRFHGKATDMKMLALEKSARSSGVGLWADPNPVEPWKWRQREN
ncbi:TPA: thermonuclease family protein [Klebsiella variicola subsp. variicola]|nr:thermonuclease family protein [Klebsiella variicola subsp. variicola]HCI4627471.1 thermonuclease family protein [Klebsiella variicola subsp. variicola]HCI6660954.1 thermonuclease family protein [Klebsiella variicola subsp. variicola]